MRLPLNVIVISVFLFICGNECLYAEGMHKEFSFTENTYIHTDRDIYVAGENMYYKVYLLNNNNNNEPGLKSGFMYIALRSENEVVERVIMEIDQKSYSGGSIYLDDTLSTGYYELVAYTNWMKNAGEEYYFRKPVLIVNRFDQQPESILADISLQEDPKVEFIPESNSFVEGLDNKLLIKTKGIFDSDMRDVLILNQDNDTITQTTLNAHGFSTFSLVPDTATSYFASIEGIDDLFQLPEARRFGSVLKVAQKQNVLNIEILVTEESPKIDWLRINHQGNTVYEERIYEKPFATSINTDQKNIPEGLLSIEIGAGGWGKIAERLWFNTHYEKAGVSVKTAAGQYGKRERIDLDINGFDLDDEFATLSVSVIKRHAKEKHSVGLDGYLRAYELMKPFGLNLHEATAFYGKMSIEKLNDYLIKNPETDNKNNPERHNFNSMYYMETDELILSGRVVDNTTKTPVEGARVILNTPDSVINLLYSNSNEEGLFHFVLTDFYHDKELYFFLDPKSIDENAQIELIDKFTFESIYKPEHFASVRHKIDFIKTSQDIVRVNKAYGINHLEEKNAEKTHRAHPPVLFSKANNTIYTENYAPLDSLLEITRELIHPWRVRYRNQQYVSSIVCASSGNRLQEEPIYFLDGIILTDISKLTHLNSQTIEKIQVHNFQWVHGEILFPGIIGVFSKTHEYLEAFADRTRSTMFKETLRDPVKHNPPEYNQNTLEKKHEPDLRQLLFWDAEVIIEKGEKETISFFSGDLGGEFIISVQGVTSEGTPVNISKPIIIN